MTRKSLALLLQSSHDALEECLADLRRAVQQLDAMEDEGLDLPFPRGRLDQAYAECLSARRSLQALAARA
ncbi:MAG: hypothetical protein AB1758_09380 [Candidatus Eremiobacterota bacterium]